MRQRRALIALVLATLLLSPVYYLRTTSRSALTASVREQAVVVLEDDPRSRQENTPNLEDAFGAIMDAAYELETGRRVHFEIALPGERTAAGVSPAMRLALVDGDLAVVRVP